MMGQFALFAVLALIVAANASKLICYECDSRENSQCTENSPPDTLPTKAVTVPFKVGGNILDLGCIKEVYTDNSSLPPKIWVVREHDIRPTTRKTPCATEVNGSITSERCFCTSSFCNL